MLIALTETSLSAERERLWPGSLDNKPYLQMSTCNEERLSIAVFAKWDSVRWDGFIFDQDLSDF